VGGSSFPVVVVMFVLVGVVPLRPKSEDFRFMSLRNEGIVSELAVRQSPNGRDSRMPGVPGESDNGFWYCNGLERW
jgi:hypothetical protein